MSKVLRYVVFLFSFSGENLQAWEFGRYSKEVIEGSSASICRSKQQRENISNKGKILVPMFLYGFAKGIVEDSWLPRWVCQFLSQEQAAVVRNCSSNPKKRLLSACSFSILSFDARFRYLLLYEDRIMPKKHESNRWD